MKNNSHQKNFISHGFTIIELLVVIVVLAVLAALVIVSFSGITAKARDASLQADLSSNSKKLKLYYSQYGSYPTSLDANNCPVTPVASADSSYCLTKTSTNSISSYSGTSSTFFIGMNSGTTYYKITDTSPPALYVPIPDGSIIQTITSTNCPSIRTRAIDARDSRTYWVQKLADGKCWMLTNLAYAGGGTNTYGDAKTLTNGTGGSATYTAANYYVVPSTTNYTTEPTSPSASTDGTGQYGYLYNFCGAMGGQATAACANATTPTPNTSISICPSGWRLPVRFPSNEFTALISSVNGTSYSTDEGLRNNWLMQRSGIWNGGFIHQGFYEIYWTASMLGSTDSNVLYFYSSGGTDSSTYIKYAGAAVRCLAN